MSIKTMAGGVAMMTLGIVSWSTTALARDVSKYHHLVIRSFDASSAADFSADFRQALAKNLLKHLKDTKRFESITLLEAGDAVPSDADIVLTGKIVRFKEGNRLERYMVPGMGTTSIRASIEFTDVSGQKSLLKREVKGNVVMGVFGGDSRGATNGLAKDLAKSVKKNLP